MKPQRPSSSDPWLIRALAGVFVAVPLGFSGLLLKRISKVEVPWIRRVLLGLMLSASVLVGVFVNRVLAYLQLLVLNEAGNPAGEAAVKFTLFYLMYLIFSMPLFVLIAFLNERSRLFKTESVRRNITPEQMWRQRLKSTYYEVYLGESLERSRSLFLTNDQREMHMQVVGSTGTGKTESVLLPMLANDIKHRKGALVIDGKGDRELLDRIRYIVEKCGREKDFHFFLLADPKISSSYNPLLRGNATELKDKIVGSMQWSEEFYRRMAEQAALTLLNAMMVTKQKVRFSSLHACLTDLGSLKNLSDMTKVKDERLHMDLVKMVNNFKDNQKFLSGLMADLYLASRSEFSRLLDVDRPQIDLLKLYQENKIAYFALDLQGYGDTAKRMGRMILQDLKSVSSYIQANMRSSERRFFPVYVDDAASFLDLNFVDFLNKSRSARIAIALFHQSLGDLSFRSAPNFQQQVIENTNIKIILRQDDPLSVEKFAKIAGTRTTLIPTYQTEDRFTGKGFSGTGSVREGQAFKIDPDLIRALGRGDAAVILKSPSFLTEHIKLDFFGHPPPPKPLKALRGKELEKAAAVDREADAPKEKADENGMPPDVADPDAYWRELEENKKKKEDAMKN